MEFVKTQISLVKQLALRVKLIITGPREFFDDAEKEDGIKTAFGYLVILTFVNVVLGTLAIFALTGQALPPFGVQGIIIDYVVSLLVSFVLAGLLHIWIKIFRGKGNYSQTYKLYVYSSTPKFLLGWVPYFIVSILASIYSFILMAVGSQELHGFTQKKSIVVFSLLAVLLVIVTFLIGLGVAALLGSMAISPFGK